MTTLRESLQAEIAAVKATLAAKEAKLAEHESMFADVLGRDVDALKAFVHSIGSHLFPPKIVAANSQDAKA